MDIELRSITEDEYEAWTRADAMFATELTLWCPFTFQRVTGVIRVELDGYSTAGR